MRTVTNYFIVSLATSDMMFASCIPIVIITRFSVNWILGSAACTLFDGVMFVSGINSILTLTVISLDRKNVICSSSRNRMTRKKAWKWIATTWTFSVLFSVPVFVAHMVHRIEQDGELYVFCAVFWPRWFKSMYYMIPFGIMFFIVPLIIMSYSYCMIFRTVKESHQRLSNLNGNNTKIPNRHKATKARMRLVRMFVLLVSLFAVEYFIFFVTLFLIILIDCFPSIWFFVGICIVLLNTVQNPIIYGVMNPNFRNCFIRILGSLAERVCPIPVQSQFRDAVERATIRKLDKTSTSESRMDRTSSFTRSRVDTNKNMYVRQKSDASNKTVMTVMPSPRLTTKRRDNENCSEQTSNKLELLDNVEVIPECVDLHVIDD